LAFDWSNLEEWDRFNELLETAGIQDEKLIEALKQFGN